MRSACCVIILAVLAAQASGQSLPPADTHPAEPLPFAIDPSKDLDHVAFDAPGDGALWARTETYKARFDSAGAAFIPFLGSRAPRNFPMDFGLRSISVGSGTLPFDGGASPALSGRRVSFERGALIELYDLDQSGMEQLFVFGRFPGPGDIRLRIAVTTDLLPAEDGGGLEFRNELGGVRYSQAVAVDANGQRLALSTEWVTGSIEIVVPAGFAATAAYPLTVDPVLQSFAPDTSASDDRSPDIAYDRTNSRYIVVWERTFSGTDHDVYAQLHSAATGALIAGSGAYIDFTTDYWARPKVATNNRANQFLVVAAVGDPFCGLLCVPARAIKCRTRDAGSTAMSAQTQISGLSTGDDSAPDVGGDPEPTADSFYCVVWERRVSATERNIMGRLVRTTAVPQTSILSIDNDAGERNDEVSISKSNGIPPRPTQEWMVVWRRRVTSTDHDILGARIRWNGTFADPSIAIATSNNDDDHQPTVSSPLDDHGGQRAFLVAWERHSSATSSSGLPVSGIMGRLYRTSPLTAIGPTAVSLNDLAGSTYPEARTNPSTDSDGCRFAVTWTEHTSSPLGGSDSNAVIAAYHVATNPVSPNQPLRFSESFHYVGATADAEDVAEITSTRSGGQNSFIGSGTLYYGVAWQREITSSDFDIRASVFGGYASVGGFTTRPTASGGGLSLLAGGVPAVGGAVLFNLGSVQAGPAIVLGLPLTPPQPLCAGAEQGVILAGAIVHQGSVLLVDIPCEPSLIGFQFAVQGIDLGSGGCPGFRVTDTVIVRIQ